MPNSDPKPVARIRDPELLRQFRAEHRGMYCEACGKEPGAHAHHSTLRAQGGGDVWENLRWLGPRCHGALHGNPFALDGERWDAERVRHALQNKEN